MLTITEEAVTYPPAGKLPNLEEESDYNAVLKGLGDRVGGDIAGETWLRLVIWSGDLTPRTYATWTAAATAAAGELATENNQKEQAITAPRGPQVSRDVDGELAAKLGMVDPQVERARKFANCGQTAVLVLQGLDAVVPGLAQLRKQPPVTTISSANRNSLNAILTHLPVQGQVALIDCSFPAVHTFLIEAHSDGRRYLIQGYQGVYVASWWQGTEADSGLVLAPLNRQVENWEAKHATAVQALRDVRARYGNRTAVSPGDWNTFVTNLVAAFADGTWATFATQWLGLPFAPTAGEHESISHRGDAPTLQITTYDVAHPNPDQLTSICAPMVPDEVMSHML